MTDFYIAPDFLSSHDSGMIAKKLQLKKIKAHFDREKFRGENSKIRKKIYRHCFH